jgi:hypothetical protein
MTVVSILQPPHVQNLCLQDVIAQKGETFLVRVKRFLWRSGTSSTHSWLGLELTRKILLKYVQARNVQSPPYTAYSEERSSTDCGGDCLVISRVERVFYLSALNVFQCEHI